MNHPNYMKNALSSLVKDIHYNLNQTRIFSVHTHRPYYDTDGRQKFTNMGERDHLAKDRIHKLISDCGKMKDYINSCEYQLGQKILSEHRDTIAVLHDLCNYLKHPQKEHIPQGNFRPSIGEPRISAIFGAHNGHHAGIIYSKRTAFWDISDKAYAYLEIKADVLYENGKIYRDFVDLVEDSLHIWSDELKKSDIEIPQHIKPDPFEEAARFGQHSSLFAESVDDALAKASILTSEKRFDDAAVLYNYALTKCQDDHQRARCYGCLGLSYEDSKEIVMAHSSYMTALKYNTNMPGLNVNFGNTCALLGNSEAAKVSYQSELKVPDGNHISAHLNLSQFYKERGVRDLAMHHVRTALELNPQSQLAQNLYFELTGTNGE